jgi:hypothetical protein
LYIYGLIHILISYGLWCSRREPKETTRIMFSMCEVTSIIIPIWISHNILLSHHSGLTVKVKIFSHWSMCFCTKLSIGLNHYNFFVSMFLYQKPIWQAHLQEEPSNGFVISVKMFTKYLLPRNELKPKSAWQNWTTKSQDTIGESLGLIFVCISYFGRWYICIIFKLIWCCFKVLITGSF